MTTPVQMQVILHYYYRTDDPPDLPPAVQDAQRFLETIGLLKKNDAGSRPSFVITEGGKLYVEALKVVPFPRLMSRWEWEMPHG